MFNLKYEYIIFTNLFFNFQSEGKSGKKPELATVIAPYTASSKEQLNLQKGQMILVRKKTETGWWQGEIQASGTVIILIFLKQTADDAFPVLTGSAFCLLPVKM